jgi:hypothetical protein
MIQNRRRLFAALAAPLATFRSGCTTASYFVFQRTISRVVSMGRRNTSSKAVVLIALVLYFLGVLRRGAILLPECGSVISMAALDPI